MPSDYYSAMGDFRLYFVSLHLLSLLLWFVLAFFKHSEHRFEWNGNCIYHIILSGINLWLFPSLTQKSLLALYCLQNKLCTPTFSTLHYLSLYFYSHFPLVVCPYFHCTMISCFITPPRTMPVPTVPTIWILQFSEVLLKDHFLHELFLDDSPI